MNPGLQAYSDLVSYILSDLQSKFGKDVINAGVEIRQLAKIYNDQAKQQNPGVTSVEAAEFAKRIYDKDSNPRSKIDEIRRKNKDRASARKSSKSASSESM